MYVKIQNASRKRNAFDLLAKLLIFEDFLIKCQYNNFNNNVVIEIMTIKLERKLIIISR